MLLVKQLNNELILNLLNVNTNQLIVLAHAGHFFKASIILTLPVNNLITPITLSKRSIIAHVAVYYLIFFFYLHFEIFLFYSLKQT